MELIKDLVMPPSCRTIYVSPKAQEVWQPRIQLAASAYHTLERETVKADIRKCTTHHMDPNNMGKEMLDLAKEGLVFMPRVKVGTYQGFAHKHPPVVAGQRWNWYGVVSNSLAGAKAFVEAEEQGDHVTIAKLLGYAPCCSKFFTEVWMKGYVDPVWQAAQRTNPANVSNSDKLSLMHSDSHCDTFDHNEPSHYCEPHQYIHTPLDGKMNVIEINGKDVYAAWSGSRYNGLRIAPNLPCSFSCLSTIETSLHWMGLGRKLGIAGLEELVDLLSLPTEWNCLHGIAEITTPIFRMITNSNPCRDKYIVRKHGDFMPPEAATGLHFPFIIK